ncbi:MAG: ferritin-like domain-containing protein [Candidatus Heimdallarchaeum endolithica]|uniref:Ferritin-like domain-containing protein n=1 Tax=Candidatus Heimdallarchaeum endolithica TaxID=2876572 RepID=A0A9Y1BQZ6_9ARCH|nr:MAG: ferritin-like domain-containing protein [Candidatus Heimdallarchaeum endolithica]
MIIMNQDEKLDFYKKQIDLEEQIIKKAKESVEEIENSLVKELILSIAIDSQKHKSMLNALITLVSETSPFIGEKQSDIIGKVIQEHIDLESSAIETYKELLEKLESEKERFVIRAIFQDEIRHHALLKRLMRVIIEKKTLYTSEMWDFLWEDATPEY